MLPLPASATPAPTSSPFSTTLSSSSSSSSSVTPVTLLGLIKYLSEELRRRSKEVAPGEDKGKAKEERALFKALITLLMTLVTSLITLHDLLPRADGSQASSSDASAGQNGLLAWLTGGLRDVLDLRHEYERAKKAAHQAHPISSAAQGQLKDLEGQLDRAKGPVRERLEHVQKELCSGWSNEGLEAVVMLAWGAFLKDESLATAMHAALGESLGDRRKELLHKALVKNVFSFMEGALVGCWRRQSPEHIQTFFLDVTVELLGIYLADQHVQLAPGPQGFAPVQRTRLQHAQVRQ